LVASYEADSGWQTGHSLGTANDPRHAALGSLSNDLGRQSAAQTNAEADAVTPRGNHGILVWVDSVSEAFGRGRSIERGFDVKRKAGEISESSVPISVGAPARPLVN